MMLGISLVLGILPLIGVVLTLVNGMITTVDGIFMSLILLALSATFLLNFYWELCDCRVIVKKKAPAAASKTPAPKAS